MGIPRSMNCKRLSHLKRFRTYLRRVFDHHFSSWSRNSHNCSLGSLTILDLCFHSVGFGELVIQHERKIGVSEKSELLVSFHHQFNPLIILFSTRTFKRLCDNLYFSFLFISKVNPIFYAVLIF